MCVCMKPGTEILSPHHSLSSPTFFLPLLPVTWPELASRLSHTRIRFWTASRRWEPKCNRYTAEWFPSEPVLNKLKTLEISLPHPCTLIEELHFFTSSSPSEIKKKKKKKKNLQRRWGVQIVETVGLTEMTTVIWIRPGTNCFSKDFRPSPICKIHVLV